MTRILRELEARVEFEAWFDEVVPEVVIGNLRYSPSDVLREVDPVAYREEFTAWCEHMVEDGVYVKGYTDDMVEEME